MDLGAEYLVVGAIGAALMAIAGILDALGRWRTSSHDADRDDRDELRLEWEQLRAEVKKDLQECRHERAELDAELATVRSAATALTAEVTGLRVEVSRLRLLVNFYEARHGNLPIEEAIGLGIADGAPDVRLDDVERGEPST